MLMDGILFTQLIILAMASLNKVMIIGNLTADPEVRATSSGNSLTELRLAVNRITRGPNEGERREEVTYLDVTCWGRTGEVAAQYLAKGRSVFIEGRLQMDTWEDKQTGQRRSRIRIIAENLQMLGSRNDAQQGGASGNNNYQQRSNNYANGGGYSSAPNHSGYSQGNGYQRGNGVPQAVPQQPMPQEEDDDIPF